MSELETDASGIYLEVKPVSLSGSGSSGGLFGFKHAYLVYRKPDGTTEVIRGGFGDGGTVSVETRKRLEDSKDAPEDGEKPGSRPSRRLDIPDKELDETWSKMRDRAAAIGKEAIDYRAVHNVGDPDQTSNSVVRAALDEAGVPLEKALPDGVDPDKLPGIRDNLAKKIEETRRERERPNPIESEIGGTGARLRRHHPRTRARVPSTTMWEGGLIASLRPRDHQIPLAAKNTYMTTTAKISGRNINPGVASRRT